MEHTPGPWEFLPEVGRVEGGVTKTSPVAFVAGSAGWQKFGAHTMDEAQANGRLIAAAPELLEALEKIRNLERRNFREAWDMLQEIDRIAGAAIRKAKGE